MNDCASVESGAPPMQQRDEVKEIQKLVSSETRKVKTWRLLVLATLIGTAALVSTASYCLLRAKEREDFENSFGLFALTVENAAKFHVGQARSVLEGLSQYVSAYAANTNSQWPQVTIPNFEAIVKSRRELAGLEALAFHPFVTMDELEAWNEYSSDHSWYHESNEFIAQFQTRPLVNESVTLGIYRVLWTPDVNLVPYSGNDTFKKAPMVPVWQMSPTSLADFLINFDFMSEDSTFTNYIASYKTLVESRAIAISDVKSNTFLNVQMTEKEHDAFHAPFRGPNEELEVGFSVNHPHTSFFCPIFENPTGTGHIVGVVSAFLGWDSFMANLLPDGANGVYAVVRNTCNQSYTYVINGPSAMFVGEGDHHDMRYDSMLQVVEVASLFHDRRTPIDENDCFYSFYLYPSEETEARYSTRLPMMMSLLAALTFGVMIATFFMYERFVQSKTRKVTIAAAKSSKIVSDMFPDNFRERVYQEQKVVHKPDTKGSRTLREYRRMQSTPSISEIDETAIFDSEPIADMFPATTIMFGDIADFTAWSASRDPTEVFILLEALYGAFDRWAQRLGIFKIETIGDCYVAVAGLPEPRPDHAVAMVKFAHRCLKDMESLVQTLEPRLGTGTSSLSLRIGLNSGPVMGGVLRGEKARFQLFGDTINTASRMESTGKKGRIQVSQDTADLLVEAGKESWVNPRADKVIAKGKGEMQTYWICLPVE